MLERYGLKTTEKRIHLESPVSWSFFSKQEGQPLTGKLVTLAARQALLETRAPIPEGRWIRVRLNIDHSFELLVVGRIARSTPKMPNHHFLHEVDFTHAVNPVVLALLELRSRMLERMRSQTLKQPQTTLTPA